MSYYEFQGPVQGGAYGAYDDEMRRRRRHHRRGPYSAEAMVGGGPILGPAQERAQSAPARFAHAGGEPPQAAMPQHEEVAQEVIIAAVLVQDVWVH